MATLRKKGRNNRNGDREHKLNPILKSHLSDDKTVIVIIINRDILCFNGCEQKASKSSRIMR